VEIQDRLNEIRERLARSAARSGRKAQDITLLAVTKTLSIETLRQAYGIGLRDFGENRVQEALGKRDNLPKDISWHLIGRLQTNKINKIVGRFEVIQSIDSLALARALSGRLDSRTQDVLLEVNTSGEGSKAGFAPEEAEAVARVVACLPGLKLKGLMTVGPLTGDRNLQKKTFAGLKNIFEKIRGQEWANPFFSVLSMGMSGDFETAVEEGATLVRIGTALFGQRT
jgi:pyridoxal phosphate enzyme (YggS family)